MNTSSFSESSLAEAQAVTFADDAEQFIAQAKARVTSASAESDALVGIGYALLAIRSQLQAVTAVTASGQADVVEVLSTTGAEVTDLTNFVGDMAAVRPSWSARLRERWSR
jgi:hypothetical protein